VLVAVNQTDAEQPFTLRIGGAEAALVMPPQSVASHEIMPGGLCGKKTFKVNDCPQMQKPAPDAFDITPAEIIMRGEKKEGEEISFACRIKNIGSLPTASNATLCVLFQLDGDTDIARATVCIPPLPPGGETIIEANIPFGKKTTWTAEAGWHTFFAVAEIGNCKPEANTDNNRLGTEVYFQNIGG
ncbi:MAG: hypothetical protein FWE82_10740, partial [Defluviitaleaceae bacterium]|nr:hypothetical protein [Defluviitaleaceae bacterium]